MRREFGKILLGATNYGTLIFADPGFYERTNEGDDYEEFACSFDEVRPVRVDDDYLRELASDRIEGGCYDAQTLLDMLERFDCRYSELAEYYYNDEINNNGVEGLIDISLFPESFSVVRHSDDEEHAEVYFESEGCGQHDCRNDLLDGEPISASFVQWLHSIWDEYHLKPVTKEQALAIRSTIWTYKEEYLDGDMDTRWIRNWLEPEFGKVI